VPRVFERETVRGEKELRVNLTHLGVKSTHAVTTKLVAQALTSKVVGAEWSLRSLVAIFTENVCVTWGSF